MAQIQKSAIKVHILHAPTSYDGHAYFNDKNNTECVEFIKQALHAPHTISWVQGAKIERLKPGQKDPVAPGTPIATFTHGEYPQNGTGHAAIYLGQDQLGLHVMDQWDSKGRITYRIIHWTHAATGANVDDPYAYSEIEW